MVRQAPLSSIAIIDRFFEQPRPTHVLEIIISRLISPSNLRNFSPECLSPNLIRAVHRPCPGLHVRHFVFARMLFLLRVCFERNLVVVHAGQGGPVHAFCMHLDVASWARGANKCARHWRVILEPWACGPEPDPRSHGRTGGRGFGHMHTKPSQSSSVGLPNAVSPSMGG